MEQTRTVPDDFPTDGVGLSCFLVVSDYARARSGAEDRACGARDVPGTSPLISWLFRTCRYPRSPSPSLRSG